MAILGTCQTGPVSLMGLPGRVLGWTSPGFADDRQQSLEATAQSRELVSTRCTAEPAGEAGARPCAPGPISPCRGCRSLHEAGARSQPRRRISAVSSRPLL